MSLLSEETHGEYGSGWQVTEALRMKSVEDSGECHSFPGPHLGQPLPYTHSRLQPHTQMPPSGHSSAGDGETLGYRVCWGIEACTVLLSLGIPGPSQPLGAFCHLPLSLAADCTHLLTCDPSPHPAGSVSAFCLKLPSLGTCSLIPFLLTIHFPTF